VQFEQKCFQGQIFSFFFGTKSFLKFSEKNDQKNFVPKKRNFEKIWEVVKID